MVGVEFSIVFYLQKLVGPVNFDKSLSCFIVFVAVGVVFEGEHSIVLLEEGEFTSRRGVEDIVGVAAQLLHDFFESLHLIRVIIILITPRMAYYDWYNGIKEYIWPSEEDSSQDKEPEETQEMSRIARLRRLSRILTNSIYSNVEQQQISMFYSSLIDEYPQARVSKFHPHFLFEPPIYVPLVNFTIPIKIQTPQLYCELELVIVFHEEIAANMPSFFIKNPDFRKYKPREKYVKFDKEEKETYKYDAVFGGIKVRIPTASAERWNWASQTYYKQQNIVNIVRWIQKFLLLDFFPFSKRKTQISTKIFAKSKELRDFLENKVILSERESDLQEIPLLENIQAANSLSISIQSQISILKQDINEMKNIIKSSESFNLTEFYPQTKDKKSEIILDALSSLEASKDVQNEFQKQFLNGSISFSDLKQGIFSISSTKFDSYWALSYWKSPELLW